MRKLVVSEFVSLDGVMEDPGGAEEYRHGGWTFKFDRGDDGNRFKLDELFAADTLLLGRVTYEGFAKAWPSMTGEDGFADKMNGMQKVVVSTTLTDPEWNNSTVISGNVAEEIAQLKQQPGEDILVAGSCQLVQTLIESDLVDEYRLMLFPVLLGSGKRLFADASGARTLRLAESTPVGSDGVLALVYVPASKQAPDSE